MKAMTTTERQSDLLPLWEKSVELAGEIGMRTTDCADRSFVQRQINLATEIVVSLISALQESIDTNKTAMALANANEHCTELSLMILRGEAMHYYKESTAKHLMAKIYQLTRGFKRFM